MLAKLDVKYLQGIEFRQDIEMMEYYINRQEDLLFPSIMINKYPQLFDDSKAYTIVAGY